jgi:hypothetical protein
VKINKPNLFAQDISNSLMEKEIKFAGGIEGVYIQYNKGEIIEDELDNVARVTLSYSQKSRQFSDECEFRFVALVLGIHGKRYDEDILEINLNKKPDYFELVEHENI